jgi:hypothetical protein
MKQPNETTPLETTTEKSPAPSEKRRAAGQRNGRLAAGKKSPEGLAASAQNGLKHGFYARHFCLLATESPTYFEKFRNAILAELQPITPQQYRIAQSVTHYSWLLERNFAMEVAAMDTEISSHKKQQAGTGEKAPNQMTAWLAFDSLVNRNSSLTVLYRQRTQIERQLARLRKEYAESIALRESVAYTAYIPPLPEPDNPMFENTEAEAECENEGNVPEAHDEPENPAMEDYRNEGISDSNKSDLDFTPRE